MTAKISASADGLKVTIGNAAEDALEINATAKTIKALSPYIDLPRIPVCRMRNTGGWIGTANEKVALPFADFNIGNMADTVNWRIKPTIAGIYRVTGYVHVEQANGIGHHYAQLWKNGARIHWGTGAYPMALSDEKASLFSMLVSFNGTTDYVELYAGVKATTFPIQNSVAALEAELVSIL